MADTKEREISEQILVHQAINLTAEQWALAPWQPRVIESKRPVQRPYEAETLFNLLSELDPHPDQWRQTLRKKIKTPLSLTKEEAHFWLLATAMYRNEMSKQYDPPLAQRRKAVNDLKERLSAREIGGRLNTHDMINLTDMSSWYTASEHLRNHVNFLTLALLPKSELLEFLEVSKSDYVYTLMRAFRDHVMKYLNEDELEQYRQYLRPKLAMSNEPKPSWNDPQSRNRFMIASFLRMTDEIEALFAVQTLTYNSNRDYYQLAVMAQSSKEKVLSTMDQVKMGFRGPNPVYTGKDQLLEDFMLTWIACTEFDGLEKLWQSLSANLSKEIAEQIFKLIILCETPAQVPHMIQLLEHRHLAGAARTWLEAHGTWSTRPLLDASEKNNSAKEILQTLRKRVTAQDVGADVMETLNKMFGSQDDDLPELDDSTTPDWLKQSLAERGKAKKTALPSWCDARTAAPIVVNRRSMTAQQMDLVLQALKQSNLETEDALISALRNNLDRRGADRCVWWLFEHWLKSGASPKDKWAMLSLGLLGSDDIAFKLTPMIKVWPGESQHQRAVAGLECLRKIGSDTALMLINGISLKLQFKGLKAKAAECMESIAAGRGLTRDELEDRIVPDCGLDDKGRRVFDFGKRSFTFALSPDLKATIRDEDGKVKTDLPKPGTKDNAEKAEQAVADWKLLKQQIKDVAKVQAFRLEQAMVIERRWTQDDFQTLLVQHPLMINLVRMVIWGTYSIDGRLLTTFRVTEDQTFSDSADKTFLPEPGSFIGIVHPLGLIESLKASWGEVLADYEIISPFPQLTRPVYAFTKEELNPLAGNQLSRFATKSVPAASLCGVLEKLGWQRGPAEDGGAFHYHYKHFRGANVIAVAQYQGIGIGWIVDSDDQIIDEITFEKDGKILALQDVPAIVASEVLADMMQLMTKAI